MVQGRSDLRVRPTTSRATIERRQSSSSSRTRSSRRRCCASSTNIKSRFCRVSRGTMQLVDFWRSRRRGLGRFKKPYARRASGPTIAERCCGWVRRHTSRMRNSPPPRKLSRAGFGTEARLATQTPRSESFEEQKLTVERSRELNQYQVRRRHVVETKHRCPSRLHRRVSIALHARRRTRTTLAPRRRHLDDNGGGPAASRAVPHRARFS